MAAFPQLRKDPIVDRWVLIAPERATRPMELVVAAPARDGPSCPFCEGEESRTPHEVFAIRPNGSRPDTPGWQVRVVANMFPAARRDAATPANGIAEAGYGAHEVVIESPQHEAVFSALPRDRIEQVFEVFRRRLEFLAADPRLQYVQVFKNHGLAAGASVEHVHSQILGVSRVPREVAAELHGAAEHHARFGRCAFCDLIEREIAAKERIVAIGEHMVAFTAYAGRFPYETWFLPRRHGCRYESATATEIAENAAIVRRVLGRLDELIPGVGYNLVLHTAPLHDSRRADFHWHWELLPRTTGIAGFELSTGCFLNPLPPEQAAAQLRGEVA